MNRKNEIKAILNKIERTIYTIQSNLEEETISRPKSLEQLRNKCNYNHDHIAYLRTKYNQNLMTNEEKTWLEYDDRLKTTLCEWVEQYMLQDGRNYMACQFILKRLKPQIYSEFMQKTKLELELKRLLAIDMEQKEFDNKKKLMEEKNKIDNGNIPTALVFNTSIKQNDRN